MKKFLIYSLLFICSTPLLSQSHNSDIITTILSVETRDVPTSDRHNCYGLMGLDGDLAYAYQTTTHPETADAAVERAPEKEVKVIPSGYFPGTNNFVPGTLAGVTVITPTTIETAPVFFIFSYDDKNNLTNVSIINRRSDIELTPIKIATISGSLYYASFWRYKNSTDKQLTMLYAKAPR